MKIFSIILTIFYASLTFATANTVNTANTAAMPLGTIIDSAADIIDPPDTAALNIMIGALSSLKELKKQNKASLENVKTLVKIKILPNIAIDVATELSLKKHWHKFNNQQKLIFQQHIVQSLIKDYAGVLVSYDRLDSINISVDPAIKRKDNKAIVKLMIIFNDNPKPVVVSLKMIRSTHWRIYDVVFSGVSLITNYAAQFNSRIRREGIDSLLDKIIKKLNK